MIGVFDSGFGGLTVYKEIVKALPEYDYLYFGDNNNAPYGSKTNDQIIHYTDKAVRYLFDRGASLIILACNTASAVALRTLQKKYLNGTAEKNRKILGVLIPTAEEISSFKKGSRVGLVGTHATIESGSFEEEVATLNPNIEIYAKACPLLVPLIEEGWSKSHITKMILKRYLEPLKHRSLDALVLACTHYPIIEDFFNSVMGKRVKVLNPAKIEADKLKEYLYRHPEIESKLTKEKKREFVTSGDTEKMKIFAEKILNIRISDVGSVGYL